MSRWWDQIADHYISSDEDEEDDWFGRPGPSAATATATKAHRRRHSLGSQPHTGASLWGSIDPLIFQDKMTRIMLVNILRQLNGQKTQPLSTFGVPLDRARTHQVLMEILVALGYI
jgi:hypothetical protein